MQVITIGAPILNDFKLYTDYGLCKVQCNNLTGIVKDVFISYLSSHILKKIFF